MSEPVTTIEFDPNAEEPEPEGGAEELDSLFQAKVSLKADATNGETKTEGEEAAKEAKEGGEAEDEEEDEEATREKADQLVESSHQVEVKLIGEQQDPNSPLFSVKSFEDLGLTPELLKGVYAMGFTKPSKIQERALPLLISPPYRNFIGQSQSGTGKTAAFVLCMLSRIDSTVDEPQAVCLAPTRELAHQILGIVKQMSRFTDIVSVQGLKEPNNAPRTPVRGHIIVGTPGTLQDLFRRRQLAAEKVKMFVIDEADVMLDYQGLGDQTVRVKQMLPPNVQTILFSATYKDDVRAFAERVVPEANLISLKREELSVEAIKQLYIRCDSQENKYETLCAMYGLLNVGQSIIFCHRRIDADTIAERMREDKHEVTVLHGAQDPAERDRIFNLYRTGKTKVLITTNVFARGIDILDVNLVINYDLPVVFVDRNDYRGGPAQADVETYLHRIGRTGRFGRKGISVNLILTQQDIDVQEQIENYFGKEIKELKNGDPEELEQELKAALKG